MTEKISLEMPRLLPWPVPQLRPSQWFLLFLEWPLVANSILDFSQVSLSSPISCPRSYTTVIFQNPPVLKLWNIMLVSNLSQGLGKRNSAHSNTEFTWRYDCLLSFLRKTQQKLGRELAQTISWQGKCPTRKQHSQNRMIWGELIYSGATYTKVWLRQPNGVV